MLHATSLYVRFDIKFQQILMLFIYFLLERLFFLFSVHSVYSGNSSLWGMRENCITYKKLNEDHVQLIFQLTCTRVIPIYGHAHSTQHTAHLLRVFVIWINDISEMELSQYGTYFVYVQYGMPCVCVCVSRLIHIQTDPT